MKICPFCKEEIRDDAIKCRYCQSSLLPLQPNPVPAAVAEDDAKKDQTILILDQGLVRFAKFVAGVLAIFVTVGIFLYGIDVKENLKEVESETKTAKESAEGVAKIEADVLKSQTDIQKAQGDIRKTQSDIQVDASNATTALTQAKTSVAALQEQVRDVQAREDETRAVAAKAQATEKQMETAQQNEAAALAQTQTIAKQAQAAVDDILRKQPQLDAAYAHYVSLGVIFPAPENQNPTTPAGGPSAATAGKQESPFTPVQLATLYNFPAGTDGHGQTIGFIELGGGYSNEQLAQYFRQLGVGVPSITAVEVAGGKNAPSDPNGADGEVQTNLEIAGAMSAGAHLVVYFSTNTNQGFLDAIQAAINDDANHLTVLAITWGSAESSWSPASLQSMNTALQKAALRGITVLAAAGDNGPTDGSSNRQLAVDFPGSSPWVTTVGGTTLLASGSAIVSETPWGEAESDLGSSGRGVSAVFAVPSWQAQAGVPKTTGGFAGRAIPDLVADASPTTGYKVSIDGAAIVIGGTAGAVPLWAALIARINQGLGKSVGFFNPTLYEKLGPGSALRPVMAAGSSQSSGAHAPAWNALTGWGSPDGQKLLEALRQH